MFFLDERLSDKGLSDEGLSDEGLKDKKHLILQPQSLFEKGR